MRNNKKSYILFFLFCIYGFNVLPMPVLASEKHKKTLNVAVLDMERVFSEYSFITQATEEIQLKELALQKLLFVANQELDQMTVALDKKDPKSSVNKTLDFEKRKKEIQASVDKAYLELAEKKKEYDVTLNLRINTTLDKFVKTERYDLILNRAYVLQDGLDITDSFLKQLEALQ